MGALKYNSNHLKSLKNQMHYQDFIMGYEVNCVIREFLQ